jgi:hypothetical protein
MKRKHLILVIIALVALIVIYKRYIKAPEATTQQTTTPEPIISYTGLNNLVSTASEIESIHRDKALLPLQIN